MAERHFLGECEGLVIGVKLSDLPDEAARPDSIPYPWNEDGWAQGTCPMCGGGSGTHRLRAVDAQTYDSEMADEDELVEREMSADGVEFEERLNTAALREQIARALWYADGGYTKWPPESGDADQQRYRANVVMAVLAEHGLVEREEQGDE